MRKITLLLAISIASITTFAGIKTSSAWFNAETFESYTAGTSVKTDGTPAGLTFTGWTQVSGTSANVAVLPVGTSFNPAYGGATGNVFGISASASAMTAGTGSQSSAVSHSFANALSGYVYIKTSYLPSLGITSYSFINSNGATVFQLQGADASSNSLYCTGVTTAQMAMGGRQNWAQAELLLDLKNNKAKTVKITYNGTTKTFSDITLPAGTNIKTLTISLGRYFIGGLDNTTIGCVAPDSIKNITGATTLQTNSTTATTDFSVTAHTGVLANYCVIDTTDANIQWSVSDWGTLPLVDQSLVSITRNANTRIATLSAGNISQDATITVQAIFGAFTLTKQIDLKAISVAGIKSLISTEITNSNAAIAAITDNNTYISGAKSLLSSAIASAQVVVDNGSATISDANTALSDIKAAETSFANTLSPYNDFLTYIGTVQTGYNAETRTATFFTTIKATLNAALNDAATARTSITNTTEISSAKAALKTAFDQFNADVPAYANLQTQITTVVNRLAVVNPRKGDSQFLMFTTSSVDALTAAKTTADTALSNSSTATQLNTAQTDLATALSTFNSAPRVAPSSLLYYKIYTYGVDNGDGGTTKSVLYVDAATNTLKYAVPGNVNIANSDWVISEVSTGVYTILSKTLSGVYLNGTTTSSTAMNFTLPEGYSQTNLISASTDTYFIYYIVNPSGKALEVDAFDATSATGVFAISSTPANRFRFAFQFEPVSPTTATQNSKNSTIKVYSANGNLVIDGIKVGEKYSIYNSIGSKIKADIATTTKVEVKLSKGVYIVNAENNSYKFIQ